MRRLLVVLLILFILPLACFPLTVFADEEELFEQYIESAKSFGTELPTHFIFTFSEFADTSENTDALENQSMEMRDGQVTEQTFHRISGVGYGNQGETIEETVTIRLEYIAAPYRLRGEFERKVIIQTHRPEATSPTHFPEQTITDTRVSKGTIAGGLDIGGETVETGRVVFHPTEYQQHFLRVTDGETVSDTLSEGTLSSRMIGIRVDEIFSSMALDEERAIDIVDTDASEEPGEMSIPIALTVVLASVIVATGAVGMGNYTKQNAEEKTSTYHMVIYKDFGNKIKYNNQPVYIYAKIDEITPEGTTLPRPDLSRNIEIFANQKSLSISNVTFTGEYMCAAVSAYAVNESDMESEGIVSFRFTGEGGIHQNNVRFQLIGESYIRIAHHNLYVRSGSGEEFYLPFELINFIYVPEIAVFTTHTEAPFSISVTKSTEGQDLISVRDSGQKKPIENFYEAYNCEITAQNEQGEQARTIFSVVLCYEGLLPDFLGKPKELAAFKNDSGEMQETIVAYKLGLWDDDKKYLSFIKNPQVNLVLSDEKDIIDVLGFTYRQDENRPDADASVFRFQANISFPANEPVRGMLRSTCEYGAQTYENATEIQIIPDALQFESDFQKEYERCLYMIETYMPEQFRSKKYQELETAKAKLGIEDLKVFRMRVWQFASRRILQDKERYLIESYWWDEQIASAELVVAIGDLAFDAAMASLGGPILGFVTSHVKNAVIDFAELWVKSPSIGMNELTEFIGKRFVQIAGQADMLYSMPDGSNRKHLMAWLACFTIYRIIYRWWFDKDEKQQPIGITEAVRKGIYDLATAGSTRMLSNYMKSTTLKAERKINDFRKMDENLFAELLADSVKLVQDFLAELSGRR